MATTLGRAWGPEGCCSRGGPKCWETRGLCGGERSETVGPSSGRAVFLNGAVRGISHLLLPELTIGLGLQYVKTGFGVFNRAALQGRILTIEFVQAFVYGGLCRGDAVLAL